MKKLFKITLTALLTAISVSAVADTYYLRYGKNDNPTDNSYQWSDAGVQSGNVYSWTLSLPQYNNFVYITNSNADATQFACYRNINGGQVTADLTYVNEGAKIQESQSKYYIWFSLKNAGSMTITWNSTTNAITIGAAAASYTVNTSCAHGTFTPTSATVAQGGSAVFAFTPAEGYTYSHAETTGCTFKKDGDNFTVTPTANNAVLTVICSQITCKITTSLTEGSIDPTTINVNYGENQVFTVTPPTGKQINKTATNYSGTAEISYNGNEITLSNVKSSGTLTVAVSSTADETPVVYWEQYPTIGINAVNMHGYLAERYCNAVTEAGFYWKETNDITASDISNPVTGHKIVADNVPAENGNSFHKTGANFSTLLNEPTTIYLVNYVTTSGGTGISDVVALVYKPCFPIPDGGVTFNNDEISLPKDYNFTFEVTARSAGKTPVYKWYLDDSTTPIEGVAGNTYEFTMPDASDHTITVEVTGDCGVSQEATATITSCTLPAVTLEADASTTPWANVTITATPTAIKAGSAQWSVTPDAELSGTSNSAATFRAGTPGTYTVKYVGASSACDASVNAEAEIEITVNADSEDCTN